MTGLYSVSSFNPLIVGDVPNMCPIFSSMFSVVSGTSSSMCQFLVMNSLCNSTLSLKSIFFLVKNHNFCGLNRHFCRLESPFLPDLFVQRSHQPRKSAGSPMTALVGGAPGVIPNFGRNGLYETSNMCDMSGL